MRGEGAGGGIVSTSSWTAWSCVNYETLVEVLRIHGGAPDAGTGIEILLTVTKLSIQWGT